MQKLILEVMPIVQLWELENKTAIAISDQKLKKVLNELKIEQQIHNKIEGQELKKESDDDNKSKAFDFVTESQKSEVKLGKKGCKKGEESDKSVREGKEKGVKKMEAS